DISMPGMDGIELSRRLKNEYPNIKVIVFTMYMENWFVEQLTNNGAKGFVSKNSKIIELVGAVRNVYEGNNYYCPQFKSKFGFKGNNNGIANKLDSLTKNELQIVKQFAENLTKEQIAFKMDLNNNTIDTFVANILLKLNAGDEDEIIQIAKKQKFISE
ncbi:MAG: response regulator transcription factor, partial [Bacteroidales bacterium]|nr:response regulator transcription factor [Bacteroidales bacterium]